MVREEKRKDQVFWLFSEGNQETLECSELRNDRFHRICLSALPRIGWMGQRWERRLLQGSKQQLLEANSSMS